MHDKSAASAQCTALAFTNAFSFPIQYLLSLAFSVPDPLLAVQSAATGTAQALREVPERHRWTGHAKVCGQLAKELQLPAMGSPITTRTVPLTAVMLFLVSPHPHPYNLQHSPATLPLHSDLKVP